MQTRSFLRRALQGVGAAGLAVVLSSTPADAGVGTRLANGDGDTSGECLSIEGTGRGPKLLMEPCNTNAHQGWVIDGNKVRSQDRDARGRCLTALGEGNQVSMQPCSPPQDPTQHWVVVPNTPGGDWFQLLNGAYGPQCLDVRDNGLSNAVQTWRCGPSNKGNQLWKFF